MAPPEVRMRRVMVIGCSGSGKSTLATSLSEQLQLPLIGLDLHFWNAGWKPTGDAVWRERVTQLAAAPAWVMDGTYPRTFDVRMPRADTFIWLYFPRKVCLRRVLKRLVRGYGRTRADLPEGCPEQFDMKFLRYVWTFNSKTRPLIVSAIERFGPHLCVKRLANDRDVDRFLTTLGTH